MINWFEIPGALDDFASNPSYVEKIAVDNEMRCEPRDSKKRNTIRKSCAWIEKRNHKKRIVRRFLSMNPSMDYSTLKDVSCQPAIYINFPEFSEGKFYNPRMEYCFNPYNKIYLSRRGDLRKYHGAISYYHGGYALGHKSKDDSKITNRRIRHVDNIEDIPSQHSCCKKLYGPMIEDLW